MNPGLKIGLQMAALGLQATIHNPHSLEHETKLLVEVRDNINTILESIDPDEANKRQAVVDEHSNMVAGLKNQLSAQAVECERLRQELAALKSPLPEGWQPPQQ